MTTEESVNRLYDGACDLLEAARDIEAAAASSGASEAVPATLGTLEETLQVLSASFYQLAADAASGVSARRNRERQGAQERARPPSGLAHERERELMATLHNAACGLARAARVCRDAREGVAPRLTRHQVPPEELVGTARGREVGFFTAANPPAWRPR